MMPQQLRTTPPTFLSDMGSFIATAAMNMVYIGDSELIMEQSIGDMSGMAMRKDSCVRKKPRKDARNIQG